MINLKNYDIYEIITEELNKGKEAHFTVHGNSMFPTIKDGENVKIRKEQKIKRGDVIAYYFDCNSECRIVVHRVIFLREKYVLTKGDNNNSIDPFRIPYDKILGKIELIE